MNFLYFFLFTVFFTFSSNEFQSDWEGLNVDLSLCRSITDLFPGNDCSYKEAFVLFELPSKKIKNREYISNLFNENFNKVPVKTKLLVNLLIDRKALGFQEKYLNPLLRECITQGFCKRILPIELEKLKYCKEVRFLCFEYLKKTMATDKTLLPKFFQVF